MGIGTKEKRDIYYSRAKTRGYRARSVFKLMDMESEFHILDGVEGVVDLCAAPGSWSQLLRERTAAAVVAVDVQDMAPIEGVAILKDDITSEECAGRILGHLGGRPADLVVCDGAPDVTGFHLLDEYLQTDLLKAALAISVRIARPGSAFVGKCFRGPYSGYVLRHFMRFYDDVRVVKPRSSRGAYAECFILARGLHPTEANPWTIDVSEEPPAFQVVGCGQRDA